MKTDTMTEPATLILAGSGYELAIAPEAEKRKAELLKIATAVRHVRDNQESSEAQYHLRNLAAMRIEVEKSRKIIKEPVIRIGKLIEAAAANFIADLVNEEKRIAKLVGDHAEEVVRIKREKEAAERKAFDVARAAREAAEAAAAAAENTGTIADVIAAKKAAAEREETLAARLSASTEVAETRIADGVRFAWDFEVDNIANVYRAAPEMVTMEIKRAAVLSWLKVLEESDADPVAAASLIGIRAFKKNVVSTR